MNENFSNDELMSKAQDLIKSGNSFSDIEQLLAKENFEESKIKEIIKMMVTYKNKKRLKLGLKFALLGAVFLISSCMLSMVTEYSNPNFTFILYGLTSIGVCVLMCGYILVFS